MSCENHTSYLVSPLMSCEDHTSYLVSPPMSCEDHTSPMWEGTFGADKPRFPCLSVQAQKSMETKRSAANTADQTYKESVKNLEEGRQLWEREMEILCTVGFF